MTMFHRAHGPRTKTCSLDVSRRDAGPRELVYTVAVTVRLKSDDRAKVGSESESLHDSRDVFRVSHSLVDVHVGCPRVA